MKRRKKQSYRSVNSNLSHRAISNSTRAKLCEALEARRLLSAGNTITGTVFSDVNHNGVQDPGEVSVVGITVYEDPNYNHKRDAGEQSVVTDANGDFTFTNLPADPEILRVILPAGSTQTLPANGAGIYVGKNTGQSLTGETFGITNPPTATATIAGRVYVDPAESGGNPDADGRAGVTVYVDLKNSGSFTAGDPSAVTDANGNYTITGLPAGTYSVREVVPQFYSQESPIFDGGIVVTLTTGQAATGDDFELNPPSNNGVISGTVFNDLNHNGMQDAGEPGLAGVVVYLDPNYNHKIDTGEQSVVTDGNGFYQFSNPPTDAQIVRIILPAGGQQTAPANGAGIYVGSNVIEPMTGENFGVSVPSGGSISGHVFNDLNGDHVQETGEPVLVDSSDVFIDLNHTGIFNPKDPETTTDANGNYTFTGLVPGTYTVDLLPDTGFRQTSPVSGGVTVTVSTGGNATANFGETSSAYVGGILFNDLNGNGKQDAGETALVGWKVYIDSNNDGIDESTEPTAQTTTTSTGFWYFRSVAPGTYTIRAVAPSGYTVTHAYTVTLAGGDMVIDGLIGAKKK